MRGALMVCGTASDVGKSHVVTGLCRVLQRQGVRVAPFKAQNMSLNSDVTAGGEEIGRAQAAQAMAAGVAPEVAMNPVLLKPSGGMTCQVVVMGRPTGLFDPAGYDAYKATLFPAILDCLADLRARFDVVLVEGAGSAAEINLLDRDIVNLPIAVAAGIRAILVGDIDRGGVFAALHGTCNLLPAEQRRSVGGFVINKLRGDPTLLLDGTSELQRRTGVPTLGVLPYTDGLTLDAEDSVALDGAALRPAAAEPTVLDIAVIRWPHVANTTDLDPLTLEPAVGVRWVEHAAALGDPHLIVLPGTKATIADLAWLRSTGLANAIRTSSAVLLGLCGGYQVIGHTIDDPAGVEAAAGTTVPGLGLLDVTTVFSPDKTVRRRHGLGLGAPVAGYEIHHGQTTRGRDAPGWLCLDGAAEGTQRLGPRRIFGTNLHGVFDSNAFRSAFLRDVAAHHRLELPRSTVDFAVARDAQFDRLADLMEAHLDLPVIERLIEEAG